MPVNLRDFDNVARSSGLSGARRVVVKDDKLATKGFWQQIRLSFMHKSDRIALNKGTMTAFGSAIKQQYGGEVYESVKNSDKWNEKFTNGKKLLSRDVHDFIQLCKLAEANLPPKEDSASNAEKSSTHTSSDASTLAEDYINSDQVNIDSTLTVYDSFQRGDVNTEIVSQQGSESISQSKEEDNSVKMSEENTENVSLKDSESISQRNEDENKTSRKLEDSFSDYQDASDNNSDDEFLDFDSGELDSNTDNVAQNKSKTDPLSSDENQTQSVPDEDLLKSKDILRKSEDDIKMTEKPQLRRTDLDFGDDQTNDPDKVVEFVNKVYGSHEYDKILATTTRNQTRSSQKLESELTPQEAVSTYYCAFPQDARITAGHVEILTTQRYLSYPEKSICQERMNDALSKKLGKHDDEIYSMMRQANKGLDKLPVYRGTLHYKTQRIYSNDQPYSKGNSSDFKKFANHEANGAPSEEVIQNNRDNLLVYNMKGDACRNVSLLTGIDNEVLIKPDAVITCTDVVESASGWEYYYDVN